MLLAAFGLGSQIPGVSSSGVLLAAAIGAAAGVAAVEAVRSGCRFVGELRAASKKLVDESAKK